MPETAVTDIHDEQARLAAFTDERIIDPDDRKHIYNTIGSLATDGLVEVVRVPEKNEFIQVEGGGYTKIYAGEEHLVATGEQYQAYLDEVGGSDYEPIKQRAEVLGQYETYAPKIDELYASFEGLSSRKDHPQYLGSGSNSDAFWIDDDDGRRHIVRIPKSDVKNPTSIGRHIRSAIRGRGIPHLEQIEAASFESGVTVAEPMDGQEMPNVLAEELAGATDEQLSMLITTIKRAHKAGITIDPKATNIFYDKQEGFGIIDYGFAEDENQEPQTDGMAVGWMVRPFASVGLQGTDIPATEEAHYAYHLTQLTTGHEVARRYRKICEAELEGTDRQEALEFIDTQLSNQEQALEQYRDPAWVARQIEKEKQSLEELAVARKNKGLRKEAGPVTLEGNDLV
jgi:hypothetical protein